MAPLVTPRVTHGSHEAEIRTGELADVQYWARKPQRWHVLGERHRRLLKPKNPHGSLVPRLIRPEPSSLLLLAGAAAGTRSPHHGYKPKVGCRSARAPARGGGARLLRFPGSLGAQGQEQRHRGGS